MKKNLSLHNTLGGKLTPVEPIDPPNVRVYTCGPTVYLDPHIGNWRTFIFYDLLVRVLKKAGYEPEWVLNVTDVGHLVSDEDEGEDKLVKTAKQKRLTAWDVAEQYTDVFLDGMKQLNISHPDHMPRATGEIQEQIELIKTLEEKGFTYQIDDGVYFDTEKLDDYGKLANVDIARLQAGARVEHNYQKRNATDFALWKFTPEGVKRDMEWDSPWGKGFPGWHIECSAMAQKYLGETLDIHAGGVDHINVHHTNEIAQSEASTGKPLSNIWVHAEFLLVEGRKMSKSLGNIYTLEDVIQHGFDPAALKLKLLQGHYRTLLNFTWKSMEGAQNVINELRQWSDLSFQEFKSESLGKNYTEALQAFSSHLFDDLDTPEALAVLNAMVKRTEDLGIDSAAIKDSVEVIDNVLGLDLKNRQDITDEERAMIDRRETARKSKDFPKADELRRELEQKGIGLRDTPQGAAWYRLPK